ncbi:hypothetical protein [Dyella mobilis]|uniref:Bacteriophage protein n=1 Tax=Dyella mobilis TaxID=1849582 RepID=A0ABS2KK59_9GAMM|nr:hypothetical protein [Dyella mobilis]MBM7131544.1 hypothetical protein [Dyella mobilis]GLQ96485.1 hypothetical protein GCM10007863_09030 [Dyella mobilis]
MRYRKLDANGDYTFGHGQDDFYTNVPAAVAQAVETGLKLFQSEWFLDTSSGVPWRQNILGKYAANAYDLILKNAILTTQGVQTLDSYSSTLSDQTRALTVTATIDTIYGPTDVTITP